MREDIKQFIDKHSTSMSKYQIKHFVLSDKITDYKIVRQILMEIESRYNLIAEEELQLEEMQIKLKYSKKKEAGEGEFAELAAVETKRLTNSIEIQKKRLMALRYELEELEASYDDIKTRVDIDSLINNEEEESEYWISKFTRDAQFDIMTTGKLQKGLLEAMSVLPIENQDRIVKQAISNAAQSNGYLAGVEQAVIGQLNKNGEAIRELKYDTPRKAE